MCKAGWSLKRPQNHAWETQPGRIMRPQSQPAPPQPVQEQAWKGQPQEEIKVP